MDPRNVNGGVFLGLNGVVIKSHGGADAVGTAHAVEIGYAMARHELLRKIRDSLSLSREQFPTQSRLRAAGAPVATPSGSGEVFSHRWIIP